MDQTTLRIAFSAITAVLLLLFYAGIYRPTGAPFSGWWTLSMGFFIVGSLCYLGNGHAGQVVLNPLGNGLAVAGAEATWCGSRTLRARSVPAHWLVPAPLLALAAGLLGDSRNDTWSGGVVLLALLTLIFAATTRELVLATRVSPVRPTAQLATSAVMTGALTSAATIVTVFYAARTVAFVAIGPHSEVFVRWFGPAPTTLLLIVQLVTVSFSMSALSTQQQLDDLTQRAVYDQLTGLLRPQEFRTKAADALPVIAGAGELAVLVMADLDHFKLINDDLGHATGDEVLRAFGKAANATLGPQAVCGRVGGEEFALLFPALSLEHAERVLATLTAAFQDGVRLPDGRIPTVSMGMVEATAGDTLGALMERADAALYEAKARGRSRVARA